MVLMLVSQGQQASAVLCAKISKKMIADKPNAFIVI